MIPNVFLFQKVLFQSFLSQKVIIPKMFNPKVIIPKILIPKGHYSEDFNSKESLFQILE